MTNPPSSFFRTRRGARILLFLLAPALAGCATSPKKPAGTSLIGISPG
jgi:hypothetical protein